MKAMTSRHAPGSIGFAQDEAARRLELTGVHTARLDARVLIGHAMDRDTGWLIGHPEAELKGEESARLEALLHRREAREPLAYILGLKEFWSLEFQVSPATLIPRPETETLVQAVLDQLPRGGSPRVLDLGTGSGCLLLAILSEWPKARGIGLDKSAGALEVARANAETLDLTARVEFFESDWFSALMACPEAGTFDAVVTNPPYVAEAEVRGLEPEVSLYEPAAALLSGTDGLEAYQRIFDGLRDFLRPGGLFVGEIGSTQGDAAFQLARQSGLGGVNVLNDNAGLPRCVTGRMAES